MEFAKQIVIEASHSQAIVKDKTNNSNYINQVNSIIINPGDEVSVIQAFLNTKGGGDSFIEITGENNKSTISDNKVCLETTLYKTNDAKNLVMFPYHSLKKNSQVIANIQTEDDCSTFGRRMNIEPEDYLVNYSSLENKDNGVNMTEKEYRNLPNTTQMKNNHNWVYTETDFINATMTQLGTAPNFTYEGTSTSEKLDTIYVAFTKNSIRTFIAIHHYASFFVVLRFSKITRAGIAPNFTYTLLEGINIGLYDTGYPVPTSQAVWNFCADFELGTKYDHQAIREQPGTGTRFYPIYKQKKDPTLTDYNWKRYVKKIPIVIPASQYTPDNLCNFITLKLNEKTLNQVVNQDTDEVETFTNSFRFFNAMTYSAMPNIQPCKEFSPYADENTKIHSFFYGFGTIDATTIIPPPINGSDTNLHFTVPKNTLQERLFNLMMNTLRLDTAMEFEIYGFLGDGVPKATEGVKQFLPFAVNRQTGNIILDLNEEGANTYNNQDLVGKYILVSNDALIPGIIDPADLATITPPDGTLYPVGGMEDFLQIRSIRHSLSDNSLEIGLESGVADVYNGTIRCFDTDQIQLNKPSGNSPYNWYWGGVFNKQLVSQTDYDDRIDVTITINTQSDPAFYNYTQGNTYFTISAPITSTGLAGAVRPGNSFNTAENWVNITNDRTKDLKLGPGGGAVSVSNDVRNGNLSMGSTCMNYGRWSLKNEENAPSVDDIDDPKLMPLFVKYPNYWETGSLLGNYPIINDAEFAISLPPSGVSNSIYIGKDNDLNTKQPYYLDLNVGSSVSDADAEEIMKKFYNFVKAQITDGLISGKVDGETGKFYAYLQSSLEIVEDNVGSLGIPDDINIRNRPRGLIIAINYSDFQNPTYKNGYGVIRSNVEFDSATEPRFMALEFYNWVLSTINDPQSYFKGGYGFYDSECLQGNTPNGDTKNPLYNQGKWTDYIATNGGTGTANITMKFGWFENKYAWKNHSAYMCSYSFNSDTSSMVMYNSNISRQSQDIDSDNGVRYNKRIGLGAYEPNLTFDAVNSRCYFSQFHLPQKEYNSYDAGITQEKPRGTTQEPLSDFFGNSLYSSGKTRTVEINPNAGLDCVFYNKRKWNMINSSLFQGATQNTYDIINSLNIHQMTSGNDYFNVALPIWTNSQKLVREQPLDLDYKTRLFCFDADSRLNSYGLESILPKNIQTPSTDPADMFDGFTLDHLSYSNLQPEDEANTAWRKPGVIFYGSYPGEYGFQTQNSEALNGRPISDVLYDTQGGFAVCNFGIEDTTNNISAITNESDFNLSLWKKLGFSYKDLFPDDIKNQNQFRNFTTTFMTKFNSREPEIPINERQSKPYTTNADLTAIGFIGETTNLIGANRFNLSVPQTFTYSALGLSNCNDTSQETVYKDIISIGDYSTTANGGVPNLGHILTAPYPVTDPPTPPPYSAVTQIQEYFKIDGGSCLQNGELIYNEFSINTTPNQGETFGTKHYASNYPNKITNSFYVIRSNIIDNLTSYINNNQTMSVLPVVGIAGKNYNSGDFWWSSDNSMRFTATRRMVLSELITDIRDNYGNPALLEPNSTIFYKIERSDEFKYDYTNEISEKQFKMDDDAIKKAKLFLD